MLMRPVARSGCTHASLIWAALFLHKNMRMGLVTPLCGSKQKCKCPAEWLQRISTIVFYGPSFVLQGPFPLQDLAAWVHQGHFIASMQVYHISDPTTAYTLEQLFAQQTAPVTSPHHQLAPVSSVNVPTHHNLAVSTAQAAAASDHSQRVLHQSTQSSTDYAPEHLPQQSHQSNQMPGQANHPVQQPQPSNLASPTSNHTSGHAHPAAPKHWQQQDLTAQAQAIAEDLRQELLESGKRAVYQLVMKNLREALPGIQRKAREAREAAAAKEAAEAELLQAEAEAAAQQAAAEKARRRAEARARAAAAEL